jgi:DNA repair protein RecO (recombination protein O)
MAAEKALALVVRGTDWSETSRITTLFTREFGKVRALAKGGRRLNSNFDVAFDLLTVCRIVFLRKSSGGLDLLTEARVEERFPVLREDLTALYAGYYVAELLADGTQDYDPHAVLFDRALDTLRGLREPGRPEPQPNGWRNCISEFELVWLRELGYSPRLDACAGCGVGVVPGTAERMAFSPSAGGVLCASCAPSGADRRWISAAALEMLRELTADEQRPPRPVLSTVSGELRQVLGQTVSYVLGRRPRLLSYLDAR